VCRTNLPGLVTTKTTKHSEERVKHKFKKLFIVRKQKNTDNARCDPMLDAAAAAEEDRRRVRQKDLRKWIICRLNLANSPPLPFAPCIPVIAERLERGRIFEQPLTPSTLKDYCFRNPERAVELLLSLDLDSATAVRIRDGPPPKPRVRHGSATGDLPVVNAPRQKRRLGPRCYDPAIGRVDSAGRDEHDDDGTLATSCTCVCVCVCVHACNPARAPASASASTLPHMGRRVGSQLP
jgi:hypothetical protein